MLAFLLSFLIVLFQFFGLCQADIEKMNHGQQRALCAIIQAQDIVDADGSDF